MKIKFNPLLAGVALLALASAANAGQPLSDRQMDGVTAGLGNNLIAIANAAAVSIGNFDSATATLTATVTDQGLGSSVAEFCHHGGRDLGDHRRVHQGWFQRNRGRLV